MKRINQAIYTLSLALLISFSSLLVRIALPASAPVDSQAIALPIVMYHHILKEQARLNAFTISPDELRQDLQYLKENGYQSILIQDLIDYVNGETALPEKPVMITFDDGYESFYEYAFPILKEMGFKAVLSVVGTYADRYSCMDDHHICYSHCTWNESESVYRQVLISDIGKMQDECRKNLDRWLPTAFAYPYGQISEEALPVLKEMGFKAALTCTEKINYLTGDPEELYHLNRFNRPHGTSFQRILENASRGR